MRGGVATLYLLAIAVWLGTLVFHSFIVAPTLFQALPTSTAGDVVARIFPTYYRIGYVCATIAVLAPWYLLRGSQAPALWRWASVVAGWMLVLTLAAGAIVHPRAAALRQEMAGGGERPEVRAEFRRLHAAAVALNVVVLASGIALVGVVARQLR